MSENRTDALRSSDQAHGAYALAILYTLGYIGMVGSLMFFEIPEGNRELLISLGSIMSAVQLGIIKHYYDSTKGAEQAQVASIARSSRNEGTLNELAKVTPEKLAAAVVAASGANGKSHVSAKDDARIRAQQESTRVQAEIDWLGTEIARVEAEKSGAELDILRAHLQGKRSELEAQKRQIDAQLAQLDQKP